MFTEEEAVVLEAIDHYATKRSRTSRGAVVREALAFSSDEKRAELGSGSPGIPEACFVMALRR